jgi:hypothetical protein
VGGKYFSKLGKSCLSATEAPLIRDERELTLPAAAAQPPSTDSLKAGAYTVKGLVGNSQMHVAVVAAQCYRPRYERANQTTMFRVTFRVGMQLHAHS